MTHFNQSYRVSCQLIIVLQLQIGTKMWPWSDWVDLFTVLLCGTLIPIYRYCLSAFATIPRFLWILQGISIPPLISKFTYRIVDCMLCVRTCDQITSDFSCSNSLILDQTDGCFATSSHGIIVMTTYKTNVKILRIRNFRIFFYFDLKMLLITPSARTQCRISTQIHIKKREIA